MQTIDPIWVHPGGGIYIQVCFTFVRMVRFICIFTCLHPKCSLTQTVIRVYICNRWISPQHRKLTNIGDFIENTIRRMSRDVLRNTLSRDKSGCIYERQFQMEFYKVGSDILGSNYFLSPDPRLEGIQNDSQSDGFIDFIANGNLGEFFP